MIQNFYQLTPIRFLTVYIVQGAIFIFFLYLAYKILKRDTKRLNLIFSAFYISEAIGLLMNFIYAPLTVEIPVKILNFTTNFFLFFGPVFLLIFVLILLKSEKIINTTKQLIIIILYGIAIFGMIFITFIPNVGVHLSASNNWTPIWNIPFFIYIISIVTLFSTIPTLYYSYKVYRQFSNQQLKFASIAMYYGVGKQISE
ncbi:MAG: hypothetical protein P8Y70_16430 [Candidatus Lokiarchaeota archaeon]